jgi:excisionase family DNA binding protein
MSDRVLVSVPGLGTLALDIETYQRALAEGARLAGPSNSAAPSTEEPALDAAQLAAALGLPVTWVEAASRAGKIPTIRAGRWRRFNRAAVEAALANGKGARA